MSEALGTTITALIADDGPLMDLGDKIGKLYTDHGLPLDISLSRLELTKQQKIVVLTGAFHWLIEHRRNSGATEAAIERQRKANRGALERFISTDETGVY